MSIPTSPITALTLTEFIVRLASTAPSPGSGAAAAVVLALAAGTAAKAFAISHRHTGSPSLHEAADRARRWSMVALEGAQRDGDDFRQWLASHSRHAEEALEHDARILFGVSSSLKQLIAACRPSVVESLIADLDAALELAQAFDAIETQNSAELQATKDR